MKSNSSNHHASKHAQRGAVLFVALVMLILLALLGITGMQIAGMQERMSANYRANGLAFQNAEGLARNSECVLEDITNSTPGGTAGCDAITQADIDLGCDTGFTGGGWTGSLNLTTRSAVAVRLLNGECIKGDSALDQGVEPLNEDPTPVYQVSAYMTDDPINPAAATAVDTIFRP